MNFIGRIFIVLIFVMSLVFMTLSAVVYATHTNWKEVVDSAEKPLGLKQQLSEKENDLKALEDQIEKQTKELEAERSARRQRVTQLEQENLRLNTERDQQESAHADLVKAESDALAQLKAAQEAETALRDEVVTLRGEIRTAQQERDKHFEETVKLTDSLHQANNERLALEKRVLLLSQQKANMGAVLKKAGLPEVPDPAVPPVVEGVVLNVRGNALIEISIGSDDLIRKGHTLDVFRQGNGANVYLGRVEVTQTEPNRAACKVLPEFRQRPIQRDDRVTTKLR